MRLIPVESSNIERIGYDAEKRILHVRFKGGATYAHHDVPAKKVQEFHAAKSKGTHYHDHFRGKYGVKNLEPHHG